MSEGLAYVDGQYCALTEAKISIFDPGFTHSDVVYDVTSVWKGQFFRLDEHLARFLASCAGIHLECPYDAGKLKSILATCVSRGGVKEGAYVSMALTRGRYIDAQARKSRDIFRTRPTFIAYALPYQWIANPERQDRGLHVIISKTPRIPSASVEMRYKNFHWGDLTQGKFEARAAGADEAVHCAVEGYLTEGAGFNVFWVKDGQLFTPARNVLAGVTRQSALDLAEELGIPNRIGDFPADALRDADEAFITSTAGGIMPVVRVDQRELGTGRPGPIAARLREEYWKRRDAGWLGTPVDSLQTEASE
jgi:branched-chain amino acid aminotransferase